MRNNLLITSFSAGVIATIIAGTIYVCVQQTYRAGANDPQLQIARGLRDKLEKNASYNWIVSNDTLDIGRSLDVFTVVYDANGSPLQSNGLLDGKLPKLPKGVLNYAVKKGRHNVTWQPRGGLRFAMVVVPVNSQPTAFVASGRSLSEVEERVGNMTILIIGGWLGCLGVIIIHYLASLAVRARMENRNEMLSRSISMKPKIGGR